MKTWLLVTIVIVSLLIGWFSTKGVKSQWIRIADVVVFGPVVIYAGTRVDQEWLAVLLIFLGASTMTYNLRNFINEWKG